MGSCASFHLRKVKREPLKLNVKAVYLKNIRITEGCRLRLSNELEEKNFFKVPIIDIRKSDLYNRRMNQTQESEL